MATRGIQSGRALTRSVLTPRVIERFWNKVEISDGCWLWTGANVNGYGHGALNIGGWNVLAHRLAYVMAHGALLPGEVVRHLCDHPSCVRPEHLAVGTPKDIQRDRVERRRPQFVDELRRRFLAGDEYWDLTAYGLTPDAIRRILANKTWHDPNYVPRELRRKPFQRHSLTPEQVEEARRTFVPRSKTHGTTALARRYGVARSTMWEIIHQTTSHKARSA